MDLKDANSGLTRSDIFNPDEVITPAFVYDKRILRSNLTRLRRLDSTGVCRFLFPLKAASLEGMVKTLLTGLDGLAASSLFEARFARTIARSDKTIHLTTPGLRESEIPEISTLCNAIAFNSLSQLNRFAPICHSSCSLGIRVNPGISLVTDSRYDTCQPHSKLGINIHRLSENLAVQPHLLKQIKGIHFHTNCESLDYAPLVRTVEAVLSILPNLVERALWINIGGGYLISDAVSDNHFRRAVALIQQRSDCMVFFEPGAGMVTAAGYLVASVIDLFDSDGCNVAILDTSVNHMPEIFEYRERPRILHEGTNVARSYLLAGSTCLAGDLFGHYRFAKPLAIGDRVIFLDMGAYTLVKAHMFNGINLPAIYSLDDAGLVLETSFTYSDFLRRSGHCCLEEDKPCT